MLLSTEEIALAANADVLLTKNRIIEAVYQMFGRLADTYRNGVIQLPHTLTRQHPKISRGENYLGLPWVILDYPRNFTNPDVFAARTMFWWGNYVSLQLLLKGACLQMLNASKMLDTLPGAEWFFCIGSTPWQHHFEENYMQPLITLTPELIDHQKEKNGFFKIGTKLPVTQWNNAEAFLQERFSDILGCVLPVPAVMQDTG